jgi:hypothetical protein
MTAIWSTILALSPRVIVIFQSCFAQEYCIL